MNPTQRIATWLALLGLAASTVFGWILPWALVMIYWSYQGFRQQQTFLLFPVARSENPVTYWILEFTWLALGLLWLLEAWS